MTGTSSSCTCNGDRVIRGIASPRFAGGPPLAEELARIVKTCKPDRAIDVAVETTLEEIVGVDITTSSDVLERCVEAALWNAWLVAPGAPPRVITRVHVDA